MKENIMLHDSFKPKNTRKVFFSFSFFNISETQSEKKSNIPEFTS